MAGRALINCRDLSVSVPDRLLVERLELSVHGGEFIAMLGRNGVGKSLTLHCLAGLFAPDRGEVFLDGSSLGSLSRREIAARLALLPQYTEDIFPATVFDTAMIGRHPHIGRFRWETVADREIAGEALRRAGLASFVDRDVLTLSGGERRRLAVAQVLTQEPRVFLLDEPTNHLDPQHQLDVLSLFTEQTSRSNAVVASLHDVNLASRFAHRCLLLYGDGRWEIGPTESMLTAERLSELYDTSMDMLDWRGRRIFVQTGEPYASVDEAAQSLQQPRMQ